MLKKEEIIEGYLELTLFKNNILYLNIIGKREFTVDSYNIVTKKILEFSNNSEFHLITDISRYTSTIKFETRNLLEEFQKNTPKYLSNNVVVNNSWNSIILGAFLKVIKISIQTNVFSSLDKAIEHISKKH